jgi:hypothetical protein
MEPLTKMEYDTWQDICSLIDGVAPGCRDHPVNGPCLLLGCRLYRAIRRWGVFRARIELSPK